MEYLLATLLVISLIVIGVLFILLRRSDAKNVRYEAYLLELNEIIYNYKRLIDGLFEMNIHYYDEVVHEFVEKTKELKNEIDTILQENGDLADYIYPDELKPEEPKEVIGVFKQTGLPK
jgi:cbb3-type cytochrome oxidase subunit 3